MENIDKCFKKARTIRCKECREFFETDGLLHICPKCLSKERKKTIKQYYETNRHKIKKWKERIGLMKTYMKGEPEWEVLFNPVRTSEKCAYCNDYHYEEKSYFHDFCVPVYVFGLNIGDLKQLIREIKQEIIQEKKVDEILEARGLNIDNLIEDVE